ncbi:hypothetical protein [Candidatus Thiodictyon syntrophicum]
MCGAGGLTLLVVRRRRKV